jgi:hypothetical protein
MVDISAFGVEIGKHVRVKTQIQVDTLWLNGGWNSSFPSVQELSNRTGRHCNSIYTFLFVSLLLA